MATPARNLEAPAVELPPGIARMVELGLARAPAEPHDASAYALPARPLGGTPASELVDWLREDR